MSRGKLVAIGDIHGESDKLTRLLANLLAAGVDLDQDTFIFVGDYIDGGPDSKYVVEGLMEFQRNYPHWVFLKGNHEDLLANAYFDRGAYGNGFLTWYNQGGMETFQSYLGTARPEGSEMEIIRQVIPQAHVLWLDRLPLFYETKSFFFVHAGVRPNQRPNQVSERDALWIRKEFIDSTYNWGKIIVAGHTAFPSPRVMTNKVLIDTMWHGDGEITAVILDDETGDVVQFVQSG